MVSLLEDVKKKAKTMCHVVMITSCKHAGVVDYFDPFSLSELMDTVVVWVDHYSTRNSRQHVVIQSLDDAALSIFSFLPAEILLLQFFPSKIST